MIREQIRKLGEQFNLMKSAEVIFFNDGEGFAVTTISASRKRFLLNKEIVRYSRKWEIQQWDGEKDSGESRLKVFGVEVNLSDEEVEYLDKCYHDKIDNKSRGLKYATQTLEQICKNISEMEFLYDYITDTVDCR